MYQYVSVVTRVTTFELERSAGRGGALRCDENSGGLCCALLVMRAFLSFFFLLAVKKPNGFGGGEKGVWRVFDDPIAFLSTFFFSYDMIL